MELVSAVLDGDRACCVAALPFITGAGALTATDLANCCAAHERAVYVDATPDCIGIVEPGCAPVSMNLPVSLPIYFAEYLAALTVILSRNMFKTVLYSDNLGVMYNLRKGRCPRHWLRILLSVFKFRSFSVHYIPTSVNPAEAASRCLEPIPGDQRGAGV